MRRRLTVAMVALTVGTLLVTGAVTVVLTVRNTRQQTRHELQVEATGLATSLGGDGGVHARALHRAIALLKAPLRVEQLVVLTVGPGGHLVGSPVLPAPLTVADLDLDAVLGGQPEAGLRSNLVYAEAAFTLRVTRPTGTVELREVVLLTRRPTSGIAGVLPWLLASSAAVALVAVVVADRLGRRLVRPLRTAEAVTARIAAGDLAARVDDSADADPELRSLGSSINTMAAALAASQHGQRQFLLSVSHELRTPLTAIQGFAEAIEDGTATDVGRAAGVIGSEGRRLGRLVSDLLDLARLDAGEFSLRPGPVLLAAAVEAAVMAFEPAAAELGLALEVATEGAGFEVVADPDRLTQVITNLVENALNHARTTVRVAAALSAGAAVVWVDDDGVGIDPEDLPRVFTRLFSSGARPGRRVGTGLGLAIVAELVGSMGGHARAESPLGPAGGTRMVVTLRPVEPRPDGVRVSGEPG